MKPTAKLHESGQSLWLDNISREMLDSGQLQRYIDEYSVTGLTSNPSIFDKAIASGAYDDEIRRKAAAEDPEELFFALAFEDLGRAADLLEPIHRRTSGVDDGSRSRSLRSWPMTRAAPYRPPPTCTRERAARTCSSRSLALGRAWRRSRSRSSPASR